MQEALPRVRTDIVTEQRRVLTTLHPVMPAVLFVGPTGGQVTDRLDLVVNDRLVAQAGADHAEAFAAQPVDQAGEAFGSDYCLRIFVHRS
jgi:hypothetical protein